MPLASVTMKDENKVASASERSSFKFGATSPRSNLNRRSVGTVNCRLAKTRARVVISLISLAARCRQHNKEEAYGCNQPKMLRTGCTQEDGGGLYYYTRKKETRTFSTMTRDLLELKDWLQ